SRGTLQTNHYDSGLPSYNVGADRQATVTGSWVSDECGYYQIDMALEEFSSCSDQDSSGFGVVAARFIHVVGCESPTQTPTSTPTPTATATTPSFTAPPRSTPSTTPTSPPIDESISCTD